MPKLMHVVIAAFAFHFLDISTDSVIDFKMTRLLFLPRPAVLDISQRSLGLLMSWLYVQVSTLT